MESAEDASPTLDEVDSVFFSRPPYSQQEQNLLVWYAVIAILVVGALVLVVGANLDLAERRSRLARAIVPMEFITHRFLCLRLTLPQENVPCEITEQYYTDGRLLAMRNDAEVAARKQRIGFGGYLFRNGAEFAEVLLREHLILSFLFRAIPTFTRVKRAALIIMQMHVCMVVAALVFNVREHDAPLGSYAQVSCSNTSKECQATIPLAFLAAAVACPVFRFLFFRQVRLTCFVSQSHPSTSRFPLGMRKFARLEQRSVVESALCMRNAYERHKARITQQRPVVHRIVHALWLTTQSSIKDLRFYSPLTSWFVFLVFFAFTVGAAAYTLAFTVYLQSVAAYHWLEWTLVMFAAWTLIFEPLLVFWTQVLWSSLVAAVAQKWGYGGHALAATTSKYHSIVGEVDDVIIRGLKDVASVRIQRWWLGMQHMYKQVNEQTAAAIKIQAVRKKQTQKKRFLKERKWCMRVQVVDCAELEEVFGISELSPFIRLKCDHGNPNTYDTKVAWNAGNAAKFDETFFVDIKDSNAMIVEAWCKGLTADEFLGRGGFDFNELKAKEEKRSMPEGHIVKVDFSQRGPTSPKSRGHNTGIINLRVTFLDPLKDQCGVDGGEDWMLPKNRMKFALSKMGRSGKLKVGKMLGALTPKSPYEDFSATNSVSGSFYESAGSKDVAATPKYTKQASVREEAVEEDFTFNEAPAFSASSGGLPARSGGAASSSASGMIAPVAARSGGAASSSAAGMVAPGQSSPARSQTQSPNQGGAFAPSVGGSASSAAASPAEPAAAPTAASPGFASPSVASSGAGGGVANFNRGGATSSSGIVGARLPPQQQEPRSFKVGGAAAVLAAALGGMGHTADDDAPRPRRNFGGPVGASAVVSGSGFLSRPPPPPAPPPAGGFSLNSLAPRGGIDPPRSAQNFPGYVPEDPNEL